MLGIIDTIAQSALVKLYSLVIAISMLATTKQSVHP
jgi:hypothetical protein